MTLFGALGGATGALWKTHPELCSSSFSRISRSPLWRRLRLRLWLRLAKCLRSQLPRRGSLRRDTATQRRSITRLFPQTRSGILFVLALCSPSAIFPPPSLLPLNFFRPLFSLLMNLVLFLKNVAFVNLGSCLQPGDAEAGALGSCGSL